MKTITIKKVISTVGTAYEKIYMNNSFTNTVSKTIKGTMIGTAIFAGMNIAGNITCEIIQRRKYKNLLRKNPKAAEKYKREMITPDYVECANMSVLGGLVSTGIALTNNIAIYCIGYGVHKHRVDK